jgi:hypothetical protein
MKKRKEDFRIMMANAPNMDAVTKDWSLEKLVGGHLATRRT